MAYTTLANITNEIPLPLVIEALDDNKSGVQDDTAIAALIARSDAQVDAFLCGIFTTPFSSNIPPQAKEASLVFACETLYKRRLAPDDKNPFAERAKIWRDRLQKIGSGELPLQPVTGSANNIGDAVTTNVSLDDTLRV